MDKQVEFEFLKQQPFFSGLTDEEIRLIQEKCVEEHYLKNDVIIREGETSSEVYIIVEGEVGILKWDETGSSSSYLGKLGKGETIGEIAFLEPSYRSATIKALTPITVLKLDREAISGDEMKTILNRIFTNIALVNANRLRTLNTTYVKNLQEYQYDSLLRRNITKILLYQYLILCASIAITTFFRIDLHPYMPWLISALPAAFIIQWNRGNWSHFGLNLTGWFSNGLIAIFSSGFVIAIFYLLAHLFPSFFQDYLPFKEIRVLDALGIPLLNKWINWLVIGCYCFAHEFVARGVLQTSLQDVLEDKLGYKSVLINSFFLLIFFFALSPEIALNVFLVSIPLGLFYLKQRTLLGVFLIHYILFAIGLLKV